MCRITSALISSSLLLLINFILFFIILLFFHSMWFQYKKHTIIFFLSQFAGLYSGNFYSSSTSFRACRDVEEKLKEELRRKKKLLSFVFYILEEGADDIRSNWLIEFFFFQSKTRMNTRLKLDFCNTLSYKVLLL